MVVAVVIRWPKCPLSLETLLLLHFILSILRSVTVCKMYTCFAFLSDFFFSKMYHLRLGLLLLHCQYYILKIQVYYNHDNITIYTFYFCGKEQ